MVFLLFESMSWIEDYFVDPFLNNSFYHHSIKTQVSNIRWWPIIPNSYQSTSRKWWRCQFNIIPIRLGYWQSEQWVIVQSYQQQSRKWNRILILSKTRNEKTQIWVPFVLKYSFCFMFHCFFKWHHFTFIIILLSKSIAWLNHCNFT